MPRRLLYRRSWGESGHGAEPLSRIPKQLNGIPTHDSCYVILDAAVTAFPPRSEQLLVRNCLELYLGPRDAFRKSPDFSPMNLDVVPRHRTSALWPRRGLGIEIN
jgi:hypothetical protein